MFLVCAMAGLMSGTAGSAERLVTEVITIGFRSAQEMVPIVAPFVPSPGTVVGFQNQLVVKTTASNLEEIKALLASLDRAPANLLISVRNTIDAEVRRDLAAAFAHVDSDGGFEAGVQASTNQSSSHRRDVQRVRVLEGREAFIQAGESVPIAGQTIVVTGNTVTTVHSVEYQNVSRGFYVKPQLSGSGNRVTVQISQNRDALSASGGGSIDTRSTSTVVSGALGRWMEIGGINEQHSSTSSGIAASTTSSGSSHYGIYIKIDRLD